MINTLTTSINRKAKSTEITCLDKVELMMANPTLIMRSINSKLFSFGAYIFYSQSILDKVD